jgi:hypothetical protein
MSPVDGCWFDQCFVGSLCRVLFCGNIYYTGLKEKVAPGVAVLYTSSGCFVFRPRDESHGHHVDSSHK